MWPAFGVIGNNAGHVRRIGVLATRHEFVLVGPHPEVGARAHPVEYRRAVRLQRIARRLGVGHRLDDVLFERAEAARAVRGRVGQPGPAPRRRRVRIPIGLHDQRLGGPILPYSPSYGW